MALRQRSTTPVHASARDNIRGMEARHIEPPYPDRICQACDRGEMTIRPPHSSIVGSKPVHAPSGNVCAKWIEPFIVEAVAKSCVGKDVRFNHEPNGPSHRVTALIDGMFELADMSGRFATRLFTLDDVRTRGLPWAHGAAVKLKVLDEFEEPERISRRHRE